jgi:hypothetical protein
MKRIALMLIAVVALVLPATASAKGPSEATISGPGLESPLSFSGGGEGGNTPLGILVMEGGFFPQMFGQSPNPLLSSQPDGLGQRYSVVYTVPGGDSTSTVRQDLYPYAKGGPVTYMEPGQHFWNEATKGGWYRGSSQLRAMLVKAGLPKSGTSVAARSAGSRDRTILISSGAGIVVAAGLVALLRRRR